MSELCAMINARMDNPIEKKPDPPEVEGRTHAMGAQVSIRNAVEEVTREFQENAAQVRGLVQSWNDLGTQFAETARLAFQPFVQVIQVTEQFGAVVREAFEPVQRIREAFAAIQPEMLEAWQRAFAELSQHLNVTLEEDKVGGPAFKLFAQLGLTGLESYLSMPQLEHILKISKKRGKRAVQEYVFRVFRRNKHRLLNSMVRDWWQVPYMRKRKKIVRSAISAHKNKKYELAVPALLPLIDGLAAEILPMSKTIVTKEVATMHKDQEGEVWSECVEQVVHALIYKDYSFQKVKRPPSSVNRHGILHGRVIDYGSELNSYRVILLLNVMVKMAENKAKKPRSSS